jgi:hypothetical protein
MLYVLFGLMTGILIGAVIWTVRSGRPPSGQPPYSGL